MWKCKQLEINMLKFILTKVLAELNIGRNFHALNNIMQASYFKSIVTVKLIFRYDCEIKIPC